MILLKNATVYSPTLLGKKDILVTGGKIAAIQDTITPPAWDFIEVLDVSGRWIFPGFIDSHAHIAGAGGEGGPATRSKELAAEDIARGGITSVVGCLGTDGITRSVASVLFKTKELRARGLSAWMYTGSYQVPAVTLLGDVAKDIAFFDEIIGVGEIAIADHRSSFPTLDEFIKLCQQAKIGGMLGGKAGIVNIHIGDNGDPFDLIYRATKLEGIYYHQFLSTHCNRSEKVFRESVKFARWGAVDLTTSSFPYFPDTEVKPSQAFFTLLDSGVPLQNITMSTDSGGSLPEFDGDGKIRKIGYGDPGTLFTEIMDIVTEDERAVEKALQTVTSNVARILKLRGKGELAVGRDADLMVVNRDRNGIDHLLSRGHFLIRGGRFQPPA